MLFNAPLSLERAKYLIDTLGLSSGQTIVDFGCGDGAFLRLVASEIAIKGVGIDQNDGLIQKARSNKDYISPENTPEFIATDVNSYIKGMSPVDTIICIGAEYIFGGYSNLLDAAKPLLKPKGKLLIGTIYWKQPPSAEYLALLDGENPYYDLATSVELAYQAGYLPLDVGRANDDEWDRFESASSRRRYQDVAAREARWQWQYGYLKWGINTMGFCFLILEKSS